MNELADELAKKLYIKEKKSLFSLNVFFSVQFVLQIFDKKCVSSENSLCMKSRKTGKKNAEVFKRIISFKKIKRPEHLATPTAKHIDAITHSLDYLEKEHSLKNV